MSRPVLKVFQKKRNPEFYGRIKNEDLLAKEFRYHSNCYRNFTRQWTNEPKGVYEKGNFDAVSYFIMKEIVEGGRIVPINKLTVLYGLGNFSNIKTSYENLLKQQIVKQFGERIVILSTESKQCYIACKEFNKENPDNRKDFYWESRNLFERRYKLTCKQP